MDLTQPLDLRAFLSRHGIEARKGLGQHFLCSRKVVDRIDGALEGTIGALEIGPGPGVLTSMLCKSFEAVVALELDAKMITALSESAPNARIIQGNALDENLGELLDQLPSPRAVVSNLPYYITGPLITRISEVKAHWNVAVLMMQKEVGLRVLAAPRESARGSLSAFLQLQFAIDKVSDAPAGAFLPPPKVDSIVLRFRPRSGVYDPAHEADLFSLIRIGFRQPRKTLANNLLSGYDLDRGAIETWMQATDLGASIRPQELENEAWIRLVETRPR